MNLELFRHWLPDLRQTRNKNAYVAKQCSFCDPVTHSKSFRINLKLKVWKCYQCGRSGKSFNKFVNYMKRKKNPYLEYKYKKKLGLLPINRGIPNDVQYGCATLYESALPF